MMSFGPQCQSLSLWLLSLCLGPILAQDITAEANDGGGLSAFGDSKAKRETTGGQEHMHCDRFFFD